MAQTSNRFFDEMARLMNDAAGVAQGVRREFDTLFRSQAERILRELDVVPREEFEAVKDMARLAREENEALKARIEALGRQVAHKPAKSGKKAAEPPPDFGLSCPFAYPAAISRLEPRPPAPLEACRVPEAAEKAAFFHSVR